MGDFISVTPWVFPWGAVGNPDASESLGVSCCSCQQLSYLLLMQTLGLMALQKEFFLSVLGCSEQEGCVWICSTRHRSKAWGSAFPLGWDRLGLPILLPCLIAEGLSVAACHVLTSLLGGCELPLSMPQFPHLWVGVIILKGLESYRWKCNVSPAVC